MKLIELKITNFRNYGNETCIAINPLTVLIGKNDAGKSSILDAMDIFFNDAPIDRDDCCVRTGLTEVRIACVFDELPSSIVIDELHPTTLKAEHLLRADNKLEIIKTYDCNAAKGKFAGAFAKAMHPSIAGIDDLLSLKITELKTKALQRAVDLTGINLTAKAQIRQGIWASTEDLQLSEREVSLKKESAKDAFDQIQKYMPIFALFKSDRASTDQDEEAQDPLKAAVKEAIRRRELELNSVLSEIKDELIKVATRTVEKIREMSPDLANQLHPTVKNKQWDSLFNVTLTGEDDIPINKRGSGTRRLILLNFFRAKAEDAAQGRDCGVIYAVEEPETSQHPNYQLMLLEAFEQLVEQGHCQVILTTHTPTLARRVDQNCLRLITKQDGDPLIEDGSVETTLIKITQTLGVLPDHDVKVFFGVEGKHDISFLKAVSANLAAMETDIPNLAIEEAKGRLVFVPLGGSSLELWVTRLQHLKRPEFYLTDRDNPPPQQPKYHRETKVWTDRGCTAWVTSKRELENYIHLSLLSAAAPGYGGKGLDTDDVPLLFAEAIHHAAVGVNPWADIDNDKKKDKASSSKKRLNNELAAQMTPALISEVDTSDEIRKWLRCIGKALNS
jgi:putative ATP-dependent endonuclease of the OLD family